MTERYKTTCDKCKIKLGDKDKKGVKIYFWAYNDKSGKAHGRCPKHLTAK